MSKEPLLPKTNSTKRDSAGSSSQALKNAIINSMPPSLRFLKKSNNVNIILIVSGIILLILSYTVLEPSSKTLSRPSSSSSSDDLYPFWYQTALKYYKQTDKSYDNMDVYPPPEAEMKVEDGNAKSFEGEGESGTSDESDKVENKLIGKLGSDAPPEDSKKIELNDSPLPPPPPSLDSDSNEGNVLEPKPIPPLAVPKEPQSNDIPTNNTSTDGQKLGAGCIEFEESAKRPGTHYLGPQDIVASEDSIASIPKTIYFVHYNDYLSAPRYLCSLESAAAHNKEHQLVVFARNSTNFIQGIDKWMKASGLYNTNRILVKELVWDDYMKDTPLQKWYRGGDYKKSHWVRQNLGNAFRLGILWKLGGIYMDLDIISMNPISGVGRSLGKQDSFWFNNAFLSFPPKDPFVWDLMEEFVAGFKGYIW
jgi:hypothetical protein